MQIIDNQPLTRKKVSGFLFLAIFAVILVINTQINHVVNLGDD